MDCKILILLMVFGLISCGPASNSGRGNSQKKTYSETSGPIQINFTKFMQVAHSQTYRERGSKQISLSELKSHKLKNTLPKTIHLTPSENDNDTSVTKAETPSTFCGDSLESINQSIFDCQKKNPESYLWDGEKNGISGEGDWQLVFYGPQKTLWIDLNTALIWSDILKPQAWPYANKNTESTACNASENEASLGNFSKDQIHWRLPTRNEFLLADINGARFVLNNLDNLFWTASTDKNQMAWAINQTDGTLIKKAYQELLHIRCVGSAIK